MTNSTQLFRFLDLLPELRLMVYDCLPTVTQRHTIQDKGSNEAIAISKHIDGAMVILACRTIHNEATALRRKIQKLNTEPLRISVEVYALGAAPLEAILLYASHYDPYRHDGRETRTEETRSILKTCAALRHVLHSYSPALTRHVEIAVDCNEENLPMTIGVGRNGFWDVLLLNNLQEPLPKRLQILLRPRVASERTAKMIEDYKVFGETKQAHTWEYSQGGLLCEEERAEYWQEGEKL